MAMKMHPILLFFPLLFGCATSNVEKGAQGTIAYQVSVESSEPGVKIEANGDYIGTTPLTLKIFGDKDGTFHNFGSQEYTITAFPLREGQHKQTKVYRCGGWFSAEDKVPQRIYFDMGLIP
jgi:hypothetical protein